MIKWSELRTDIVEGILKDPDTKKYSLPQLLVWARWACSEISTHTAEAALTFFECDGETYQFALPDNMIDNIEDTGLVGLDDGEKVEWLPPLALNPNTLWPWPLPPSPEQSVALSTSLSSRAIKSTTKTPGYWEWPSNTLTLSFIPEDGLRLVVHYFKIWDAPQADDDLLMFPSWMERPFGYLVGAGAMDPLGAQASDIRQWLDRSASGVPEQNPLHRQYEFFIRNAERILSKHRVQDRENFFSVNRPRK